MTIRVTKDIWGDGPDHRPILLAIEGEILNVIETYAHGYEVARAGRFYVHRSECKEISPPQTVCE